MPLNPKPGVDACILIARLLRLIHGLLNPERQAREMRLCPPAKGNYEGVEDNRLRDEVKPM